MKLGVFDSGIGGEAIARSLQSTFKDAEIFIVNDRANLPYGDKSPEQIIQLTKQAIQPLLDANCDIIVIACNTATALAIETLRARYPHQKFIGIEPMVKTAASLTSSHVVAVCATPATLVSERYAQLVHKHGAHLTILEPNCSEWAYAIENNQVNQKHIEQIVNNVCERGADVIVLGCTHYHWIKELVIEIAAGRATVIEPSEAIGRRVKQLLNQKITQK